MSYGRKPLTGSLALVGVMIVSLLSNAGSVARAQEPPPKPGVGFGVALTGAGGLYNYVAGRRGILHVNVVNRQDVPLELLASTYFEDEPTLQFGRKIWVPPRSRIHTWHPIQVPKPSSADGKTVRFHSLFMESGQGQEVLIKTDTGQMKHDGFLQVVNETTTGIVENMEGKYELQTEEARELIAACRTKQNLSRKVTSMTDIVFDPGDESLAALDHLVIADSRPLTDPAGLAAIRRWMYEGGKLWIMLDQVDPKLLDMIMGDAIQCTVVDRVSLTTVQVDPDFAGARATRSLAEFETPVDLVRVQVSDAEVGYSVNGWPAAFWKTCGEGRLMVTTLAPRGWMTLRPKGAPLPNNDNPPKYIPTEPMSEITSYFFLPRKGPAIAPAILEPIVEEYVGYSIPSRLVVICLLIGFSVLLAGSAVWLWRIGRLEWSGAIGPGLAIVVSLILIGLGQAKRQSVPATSANLQLVQAVTGTEDFIADGQIGIFGASVGSTTLSSTDGGWVMPDMGGMQGTIRRLVWSDLNKWQWENLPSTAGLRNAKFQKSGELDRRLTAYATFGPEGLTGELQLPDKLHATDAMLATVGGRLGLDVQPDGKFTAKSKNLFSDEQFLSADLLSDEQNRRLKTFKHLLTQPPDEEHKGQRLRIDYPSVPTLLFWTEPWDLGFKFAENSRSLGSALVTLPLELRRPPAGTEVSIAAPLLLFEPVIGPDGTVPSGIWDPRKREWAQKASPSAIWLRFQVPPVLLPVKSLSGRLVVRVTGPMGKLEIGGARDGKVVPIKTWMDPVGTLEHEIAESDLISVTADGGVLLRLNAGDPDRPELTKTESSVGDKVNYWQFESLSFELKAKTEETGEKQN